MTLRDFVTEHCAIHQRELTLAIKRARTIALLPFVVSEG
jgi:small subunit ribosomal protein S18